MSLFRPWDFTNFLKLMTVIINTTKFLWLIVTTTVYQPCPSAKCQHFSIAISHTLLLKLCTTQLLWSNLRYACTLQSKSYQTIMHLKLSYPAPKLLSVRHLLENSSKCTYINFTSDQPTFYKHFYITLQMAGTVVQNSHTLALTFYHHPAYPYQGFFQGGRGEHLSPLEFGLPPLEFGLPPWVF